LSRARAQADALNFVQQCNSAPSKQAIVFDSGAGKGLSERKATISKKGLKWAPSKSHLGSSLGHKMNTTTEDRQISGEQERRAAEIIVTCLLLGLWTEARSVYDFVAADGTGTWGSGHYSSLSLAQIQKKALILLGKTSP
jgi:hypothetical protein